MINMGNDFAGASDPYGSFVTSMQDAGAKCCAMASSAVQEMGLNVGLDSDIAPS